MPSACSSEPAESPGRFEGKGRRFAMVKLVLCSSLLLIAGTTATPVAAAGTDQSTCDAKYFSDLVGKGMEQARDIQGSNYRMLNVGSARGAVNPKRMTITVDPAK